MDLSSLTSEMAGGLPAAPVEPPVLAVMSDLVAPLGCIVCALAPDDIRLEPPPERVLPGRPVDLLFTPRSGMVLTPDAAQGIADCLETHLRVAVHCLGDEGVAALELPVSVRAVGKRWRARVLIRTSPAATTGAFLATNSCPVKINALMLAGQPLPLAHLPATVLFNFNHDLAPRGDVWDAAAKGDVPALMAALAAGGSTEEADRVSLGCAGSTACVPHTCSTCSLIARCGHLRAPSSNPILVLQVGDTALMEAAAQNRLDAARVLIAAGADVTARKVGTGGAAADCRCRGACLKTAQPRPLPPRRTATRPCTVQRTEASRTWSPSSWLRLASTRWRAPW